MTQNASRNRLRTRRPRQTRKQFVFRNGSETDSARGRNGSAEARERILNAATVLFTRHGFSATRTRKIADRARVNEALVFYYFSGKQKLYWAVLEKKMLSTNFVELLQATLASGRPDKELFTEVVRAQIRANQSKDGLIRLLLFTGLADREPFRSLTAQFYKKHLNRAYGVLADFIRQRIREGIYREVDAEVASRAFFSLGAYHVIIQELLGGKYSRKIPDKQVAAALADLWLESVRKK